MIVNIETQNLWAKVPKIPIGMAPSVQNTLHKLTVSSGWCISFNKTVLLLLLKSVNVYYSSFIVVRIEQGLLQFSLGEPILITWRQGRRPTEVICRPGQETSLAPPCLNPRSFESKCIALKKYLWHCWDFRATPVFFSAPCSSLYAPAWRCPRTNSPVRPFWGQHSQTIFYIFQQHSFVTVFMFTFALTTKHQGW